MSGELLSESDLKAWTGHKTRPRLRDWLVRNRIDFWIGQGDQIITTAARVNRAQQENSNSEIIEFD